jgi:SpoVK/Ycf46/Vps4 family AAA+-type ATPase
VFSEAELLREILFFDEADTLFGKRSEVKESHDRLAIQEVSYLCEEDGRRRIILVVNGVLPEHRQSPIASKLHWIDLQ